jgi:hypothetical protein
VHLHSLLLLLLLVVLTLLLVVCQHCYRPRGQHLRRDTQQGHYRCTARLRDDTRHIIMSAC